MHKYATHTNKRRTQIQDIIKYQNKYKLQNGEQNSLCKNRKSEANLLNEYGQKESFCVQDNFWKLASMIGGRHVLNKGGEKGEKVVTSSIFFFETGVE